MADQFPSRIKMQLAKNVSPASRTAEVWSSNPVTTRASAGLTASAA